jgi:broad specificity phosphatase PhoE
MPKIYLVRHGQKVHEKNDPPLTDYGNVQANQTASYLGQFPIKKIISSPLLRTRQTAEHIASSLKLEVQISNLLLERMNWGDKLDQSFDLFYQDWLHANQDRYWKPPIGDSSYQAGSRLESIINNLSKDNVGDVVLVTHGGIITDFLRNVLPGDKLEQLKPGFLHKLDEVIVECSITTVETKPVTSDLNVTVIASTTHLVDM